MNFLMQGLFFILLLRPLLTGAIESATNTTDVSNMSATTLQYLEQFSASSTDNPDSNKLVTDATDTSLDASKRYYNGYYGLLSMGGIAAAIIIYLYHRQKRQAQINAARLPNVRIITTSIQPTPAAQVPVTPYAQPPPPIYYVATKGEEQCNNRY